MHRSCSPDGIKTYSCKTHRRKSKRPLGGTRGSGGCYGLDGVCLPKVHVFGAECPQAHAGVRAGARQPGRTLKETVLAHRGRGGSADGSWPSHTPLQQSVVGLRVRGCPCASGVLWGAWPAHPPAHCPELPSIHPCCSHGCHLLEETWSRPTAEPRGCPALEPPEVGSK